MESDYSVASSLPGNPPTAHDIFKPTANVKFKPLPSVSGKCSKIKINLLFDSTLFVAGESIQGMFELTSFTDAGLHLGDIFVELSGYEEIAAKNFHQSYSFLSSRRIFQGDRLPQSEAVHGPPIKDGFYLASKKKTVFFFSFGIPLDAPSSFEFSTLSKLCYSVTGAVRFKYGNQNDTIFKTKNVRVIDRWDPVKELQLSESVTASNFRRAFLGGDGNIVLTASTATSYYTSGSNLALRVGVKNMSKKRVSDLTNYPRFKESKLPLLEDY